MAESSRMQWPYPGRDDDPWYDKFADLVQALDVSGYASREDRSLIVSGGGTITWAPPVLTWTAPIVFSDPLTGFLLSIAAGSASLADGQVLYTTLVRQPLQNQSISVVVASKIPGSPDGDNTIAIAVRIGTSIYFRTGFSLGAGGSSSGGIVSTPFKLAVQDNGTTIEDETDTVNFAGGGAVITNPSPGVVDITITGGGPEGWQADIVDTYLYTLAPVPVEEVVGQGMFDGARVGINPPFFSAMLTPTLFGVGWGQLRLYDIGPKAGPPTPLVAIATLTANVSGGPQFKEQVLSVGAVPGVNQIANSARMYEVRAIMSGTVGDTLFIGGGCLEVRV
jgi:hypothetical protein